MLKKDMKNGRITIALDTQDDLWTLHNLIKVGDRAYAWTLRTIERQSDKIRPDKVEKRKMYLGVRVERVDYHEFADILRVHGIIIHGPQDLGSHHTFNLKPGGEVSIEKDKWLKIELNILRKGIEASQRPTVVVLSVEDDNVLIATVHSFGIREYAWVYMRGGGKTSPNSVKGENLRGSMYSEAFSKLKALNAEGKYPVLIVGPGFIKKDMLDYIKAKFSVDFSRVMRTYAMDDTGQGGMRGIYEAMKRGAFRSIIAESAMEAEVQAVEDLREHIARADGLVEYGPDGVLKALEAGAVSVVFLTTQYLRQSRSSPGTIDKIEDLASAIGADVRVISSQHEAGRILDNLGGISALLRYRIS